MGLEKLDVQSFAPGLFRNGPLASIPPGGCFNLVNGLFDDSGQVYRRGGSVYKSNATFGAAGLQWLWTGNLAGGLRTAFHNGTNLGVLGADDATPATLFTAATNKAALGGHIPFYFHGMLVVPQDHIAAGVPSFSEGLLWGGSRKGSSYTTGTITYTLGSRSVAGAGTSWTANVDAGMILVAAGAFLGVVKTVMSDTLLTLVEPVSTAAAGSLYELGPAAAFGSYYDPVFAYPTIAVPVADRVLASAGDNIVTVSAAGLDMLRNTLFDSSDYHQMQSNVRGIAAYRGSALVFADDGVTSISNVAYDLTDALGNPQRRQEQVSDLVLWGQAGIGVWKDTLIVPCLDDVWLMDSISSPHKLSGNITDLYRSYVGTTGYQPGQATVFNNHYLLPIYDTSISTTAVVLCCKLTTGAWSTLEGEGAQVAAYASRPTVGTTGPRLLAGLTRTTGRVLDCTGYFQPSSTVKQDHDASAHVLTVETGDIPTGNDVWNQVREARVRYSLVDAASDNPTMVFKYAAEGAGLTTATGSGPEDDGRNPYTWGVESEARRIRFRVETSGACASAQVFSMTGFVSRSGRWAP